MNVAIFSVIYPSALAYLQEFLVSISNQTHKDYTLFLINDGVENLDTAIAEFDFNISTIKISGSPSAIRKAGLEWVLQQGADIVIFADSDDYCMPNRVETVKQDLLKCDLLSNELMVFGESISKAYPMFSNRFSDGKRILISDLLNSNCMGFSNSSIKTDSITGLLSEIPDDIVAFDWAFFTLCLEEGKRATFSNQTVTYYRQHANNIGSPLFLTEGQILKGVLIKRDHYRFVARFFDRYRFLSKEFETLFMKIDRDPALRAKYCRETIHQSPQSPLWWESIKTLEELGL